MRDTRTHTHACLCATFKSADFPAGALPPLDLSLRCTHLHSPYITFPPSLSDVLERILGLGWLPPTPLYDRGDVLHDAAALACVGNATCTGTCPEGCSGFCTILQVLTGCKHAG